MVDDANTRTAAPLRSSLEGETADVEPATSCGRGSARVPGSRRTGAHPRRRPGGRPRQPARAARRGRRRPGRRRLRRSPDGAGHRHPQPATAPGAARTTPPPRILDALAGGTRSTVTLDLGTARARAHHRGGRSPGASPRRSAAARAWPESRTGERRPRLHHLPRRREARVTQHPPHRRPGPRRRDPARRHRSRSTTTSAGAPPRTASSGPAPSATASTSARSAAASRSSPRRCSTPPTSPASTSPTYQAHSEYFSATRGAARPPWASPSPTSQIQNNTPYGVHDLDLVHRQRASRSRCTRRRSPRGEQTGIRRGQLGQLRRGHHDPHPHLRRRSSAGDRHVPRPPTAPGEGQFC